jgi:serine protease Do
MKSVPVACVAALFIAASGTPSRAQEPLIFAQAGGGASIGASVEDLAGPDAKLKIDSGVRISSVQDGTPAARAGLKSGDIVVEFDGERVRSVTQFTRLIRESVPDRSVRATVVRDGVRQTVNVTPQVTNAITSVKVRPFNAEPFSSTTKIAPFQSGRGFSLASPADALLGVTVTALEGQLANYFGVKQGVLVSAVENGTPAATAGIKAGDVITAIGARAIDQPSQVVEAVRAAQPGSSLELKIVRDKKELAVKVTLVERTRVQRPATGGSRTWL